MYGHYLIIRVQHTVINKYMVSIIFLLFNHQIIASSLAVIMQ